MIEGCLLLVWAFLVLVWLLWETWMRQFGATQSPAAVAAEVADELPNKRFKLSMDESEISAGGGGEEKSQKSQQGVATLDGPAFSLQELHLQLKQMECMIKMLLPYKEKLEAMHQLPSTENTCKLGCGSEGDLTLSDLCTRLKVLEPENQSLVIENGSQRLKFERCLDQVAIHVAHVLLAQQTLRGECLHLHQRVLRLEQQNHQLFKCFHHQLESLRHSKEQETQSPREHIYEIPEFFQVDQKESCTKTSPDDKPHSSFSSMYDSLEAEFPSALCSTSWNPTATTSTNQIHFGVRPSHTIPPYTSPRYRLHCTRCTADAGCHGNYQAAAAAAGHNRLCSKKDSFEAECGFGSSGGGGFRGKGVSENVCVSSDLVKDCVGMTCPGVSVCGVETKYLLEESRAREFESMESSVNDDDADLGLMSPAADLLCLSDSFYEQFRISDHGGQLSVNKRGDYCIESDEKDTEEFCIESDDTQSLFHGSDPLTRASSVSLSELLGRTPNMTSDSDTLSVDDYPFLDYRAKGSIIEENSNEDSDYEELIADEDVAKTHARGCSDVPNVQNTPGAPTITDTVSPQSGCRKNKEMLSPSREQNGELPSPLGERNLGFCGRGSLSSPTSSRLSKHIHHSGPHINVLSRCTNKKLKSAADKIFSASCRVRPVRAFQEGSDDSRYSTGTVTSPLDRTSSKMESGPHPVVGSVTDRDAQSRPSFLKISNFHRKGGPVDKGRKDGEGSSPAAFLPSGDFLWDDNRCPGQSSTAHAPQSSAAHAPQSSVRSKTHTYVNISALNLNQKPRPLLARRKLNLPSSSKTAVHGSSKRGCSSRSAGGINQRKTSPSKTSGGTPLSSHSHNSMDSSPDSDVQRSAFTSSSDSETVTEEKLPSSQDDGYSSNSLPSETSSRQLVEMSRLRSRPSRRDEQRGFVRRKTGGPHQRIVPIMGSREDLSTFEEGCEGKSDLEVDLNRLNLDDDSFEGLDGGGGGGTRPLRPSFPVSVVDVHSCFVGEIDSSQENLLVTDGNSADRKSPVQEFLNEDDEE